MKEELYERRKCEEWSERCINEQQLSSLLFRNFGLGNSLQFKMRENCSEFNNAMKMRSSKVRHTHPWLNQELKLNVPKNHQVNVYR